MSWHGAWHKGKPDPFAKPVATGTRFGCLEVVAMAVSDAHYGLRARMRCLLCGDESTRVIAQVRYKAPRRRCKRCPKNVASAEAES